MFTLVLRGLVPVEYLRALKRLIASLSRFSLDDVAVQSFAFRPNKQT